MKNRQEQAKLREAVVAAREYARSVAGGSKVKFIHAFEVALHIGIAAMTAEANEDSIKQALERGLPIGPEQYYSNPIFVENAFRWIEDGPFILGGTKTDDFPDCVAVGADLGWCCSGTLIAPKVVLTAGHCYNCASQVFKGKNVADGKPIFSATPVRHPNFDPDTRNNDLTILFLDQEVQGVLSRPLATSDMIDHAKQICIVGFGNNNPEDTEGSGIKRMATVPIISYQCSIPEMLHYGCNGGELVAKAPANDIDSCTGDSGGPAYIQSGGEWFLAGVTSRQAKLQTNIPCGIGSIYVRVDKHEDWILTCRDNGLDACRKWRSAR
jgi:Trypsin